MKDYGNDRKKACLFDEIQYYLTHGGTLEEVLEVLMDVLKDGEQDG